jgi:hypothetical protein
MIGGVKEQLVLVEPPVPRWGIDDHTRDVGRKGVEQARQALAEAIRRRAA